MKYDTSSSLARKRPKVEQTTKSRQRGRADTVVPRKRRASKNMERASDSPEFRGEEGVSPFSYDTSMLLTPSNLPGIVPSTPKVGPTYATYTSRFLTNACGPAPQLRLPRRSELSSTKVSFPQRDAHTLNITRLERELRQQKMRTWAVKQCLEKIDNAVDR